MVGLCLWKCENQEKNPAGAPDRSKKRSKKILKLFFADPIEFDFLPRPEIDVQRLGRLSYPYPQWKWTSTWGPAFWWLGYVAS